MNSDDQEFPYKTLCKNVSNKYFFILQELKSQAAKILGSVDFLGNPLGLFNDVTEGISGLLNEAQLSEALSKMSPTEYQTQLLR